MINPDENEWSRFHRIREDLSELPAVDVRTRIERLKADGEGTTIISMLELHFKLARPPGLQAGRCLANRYTIKQKIGEGGMGVVYQAVQELTQQAVALKVIHPALVSSRLIKRFREEIRTLGKLQHDHIVRVFDADHDKDNSQAHDILFYAMQLVDGLPLIRWVNERRPSTEARLECFVRICEAVDYAHLHGVVHRDLKPDNILVDEHGRPAILDFGLSQIADVAFEPPQNQLLPEGETVLQVSGTPAFMSRERWEGQPGGPPADVFALGVLLHEMMTGSRPWKVARDAPINDLRKAICNFSPAQLKSRRLGRGLAALLGSMLAPDPAARPVSAATVANTIRSLLTRRRIIRRIRRTAPIWGSLTVVILSVSFTRQYYAGLKRVEQESVRHLGEATGVTGQRGRADTLDRVIELLPREPHMRHSQDAWRDVVLEAMSKWNLRRRETLQLPVAFEPLAADETSQHFFGRSSSNSWELIQHVGSTWKHRALSSELEVLHASINPQRPQLAVLQAAGPLLVWDWEANTSTNLMRAPGDDAQFEFSPDGRLFACSTTLPDQPEFGGRPLSGIHLFDTANWQELRVFSRTGELIEPGAFIGVWSDLVGGLAFSPDSRQLANWSHGSMRVMVWNLENGQLIQYVALRGSAAAVTWRTNGLKPELAAIQQDGLIWSWKVAPNSTNTHFKNLPEAHEWGRARPPFKGQLAWTAGGEALLAIDEDNQQLDLFGPEEGSRPLRLPLGLKNGASNIWLAGRLLTPSAQGQQWTRLEAEPPIRRARIVKDITPTDLAFNADGRILALADNDQLVFFATASFRELHRTNNFPQSGSIAFDSSTGDFWAYHKTKGAVQWELSETDGNLTFAAVRPSPDGGIGLLAASGGNVVVSRGTNIHVYLAGGESSALQKRKSFAVLAPPNRVAIYSSGQVVAAIWERPTTRAQLWIRQFDGVWRPEPPVAGTAVLNILPDWNWRASPLIVPWQQRTVEESSQGSSLSHFNGPLLLAAGAHQPMIASLGDRDVGVHVDFLGRQSCIHVGTFLFASGREFGAPVHTVVSPDGAQLATVSSDGELQLWNLRQALARLAEFQLGLDEIDLPNSGESTKPINELKIIGPFD